MTDPLHIPEGEAGQLRLFTLDMQPAEARFLRDTPGAASQALGLSQTDESLIEIFPIRDLGPIGLAGYLTEGCDIGEAALEADRDKLESLTGWVMVLPSQAITTRPATLTPQKGVRLAGTYSEPRTDWKASQQPAPESAKPQPGASQSPRAARARARRIGGTIFALTMLLVVLVLSALIP